MWRAYERFFRALHPTQQLKRRILSKSFLFIFHLTECFISVNPRRLWAVLIMHYSKYFCIFRTICERYRYIAIVSYQIFVDCILVYYLKMIFWYHTKRYHLVLQVNTPLHLGKIGNDSGTMWSSTHVFLPSPREFIQLTLRPTRTWKWKDTIPYWVYPNQYGIVSLRTVQSFKTDGRLEKLTWEITRNQRLFFILKSVITIHVPVLFWHF